jgi:hypothetical protein
VDPVNEGPSKLPKHWVTADCHACAPQKEPDGGVADSTDGGSFVTEVTKVDRQTGVASTTPVRRCALSLADIVVKGVSWYPVWDVWG